MSGGYVKRSDYLECHSLKELYDNVRSTRLKNLYSNFSIEALITKPDGSIQAIVNYYS